MIRNKIAKTGQYLHTLCTSFKQYTTTSAGGADLQWKHSNFATPHFCPPCHHYYLCPSRFPPSLSSRSGHNVASRSDWSDCRITVVHKKAIFAANLASCKTGQSVGICNKKVISRMICWQAKGRSVGSILS